MLLSVRLIVFHCILLRHSSVRGISPPPVLSQYFRPDSRTMVSPYLGPQNNVVAERRNFEKQTYRPLSTGLGLSLRRRRPNTRLVNRASSIRHRDQLGQIDCIKRSLSISTVEGWANLPVFVLFFVWNSHDESSTPGTCAIGFWLLDAF